VGRFRQLAQEGYYNGLPFYTVMNTPALSLAQSGSKTGDETGKADLPDIPLEPSDRQFNAGTIGLSRTGANPDSGNSQYFIVTQLRADGAAALYRRYTIIGEIISARDEKGNPADFRSLLAKLAKDDKVMKIEISERKTR
jgi:cyclophilin family peptidyl-prolyl cis-trans isomerase